MSEQPKYPRLETRKITELKTHLDTAGVAVVVQAKHLCMCARGVGKQKSVMVTSAMRGAFRKEGAARAEFFKLVELSKNGGLH